MVPHKIERLVTKETVLQQSDGVGAKHGEECVHRPHEEAEEPMVIAPPACAKQLDEDPDQVAEEDEDLHAHKTALSAAPALGKDCGGVLDPHGSSSLQCLQVIQSSN